jgi:hypothetical protein
MQTRTGIVKVQHKQESRQPSLGPFSLAIAFKVNNRNKLVFLRQKLIKYSMFQLDELDAELGFTLSSSLVVGVVVDGGELLAGAWLAFFMSGS